MIPPVRKIVGSSRAAPIHVSSSFVGKILVVVVAVVGVEFAASLDRFGSNQKHLDSLRGRAPPVRNVTVKRRISPLSSRVVDEPDLGVPLMSRLRVSDSSADDEVRVLSRATSLDLESVVTKQSLLFGRSSSSHSLFPLLSAHDSTTIATQDLTRWEVDSRVETVTSLGVL